MSWTDVPSKPWRANRRVATLSSRSFTGVLVPGRPTDSLDLTAMRHAPLVSGQASYRPVGLKLGKLTLPGQPGHGHPAGRLRCPSAAARSARCTRTSLTG